MLSTVLLLAEVKQEVTAQTGSPEQGQTAFVDQRPEACVFRAVQVISVSKAPSRPPPPPASLTVMLSSLDSGHH